MQTIPKSTSRKKLLACTQCRSKKIKCVTDPASTLCVRCVAHDISCNRPPYLRLAKSKISYRRTASTSASASSNNHIRPFANDSSADPIVNPALLFRNVLSKSDSRAKPILYRAKSDDEVSLHPVKIGILSQEDARDLYGIFLASHGDILAYFDSQIHTFEYISSSSAILLTCILWKASTGLLPQDPFLTGRLYDHMEQVLIPAILLQAYRSVEIVQGLMMLAAFQPPNRDLSEDRSWTLLSHAITIATELDLHSKLTSRELDAEIDKVEYLKRRNAERTWMNIWLHEASLSQHTGRRSLLANDSIILESTQWHVLPLATEADIALVAMIELRAIITRNRQMHSAFQSVPSQIGLHCYLDRCEHDLASWSRHWLSSKSKILTIRLELGPLYVHHSIVQLATLLFQVPQSMTNPASSRALLMIYHNCVGYMDYFGRLLPPQRLAKCYNSTFVSASYIVILSLRLAQSSLSTVPIDKEVLLSLAKKVINSIREASKVCFQNASLPYADFLEKALKLTEDNEEDTFAANGPTPDTNNAQTQSHEIQDIDFGIPLDYMNFYLEDASLLAWAQSLLSSSTTDESPSYQSVP